LLFCGVFCNWSSDVKRVTVLSLFKRQWKPIGHERGKVKTVYIRHIFKCCQHHFEDKQKLYALITFCREQPQHRVISAGVVPQQMRKTC
jgi:hypothetical protein